MIRRSFLTALLALAPCTRLLASWKPRALRLAALQKTLLAAHGKQLQDIPWLVWKTSVLKSFTYVKTQAIESVLRDGFDDDAAFHIHTSETTQENPDWLTTYDRLLRAHGLDPKQYFVVCHIRGDYLQLKTCCFDFDRVWLRTEWTEHCKRYVKTQPRFDRIVAPKLAHDSQASFVNLREILQ